MTAVGAAGVAQRLFVFSCPCNGLWLLQGCLA